MPDGKSIEKGHVYPRKSFAAWQEHVLGIAEPWQPAVIESAQQFQKAVISLVLQKAQELASLPEELKRSNAELEAFSYTVSHDLRAPFRHIIGYSELLREREKNLSSEGARYIRTIIESANFAGSLVDHLLKFSQIGRSALHLGPVSSTVWSTS